MVEVFLNELPKYTTGTYKGKINWIDSVGKSVGFKYNDDENENNSFCGILLIKGYDKETRKLKIEYKGNISEIRACRLQEGNIKKLIGAKLKTTAGYFAEYKIEIGKTITDNNRDFLILDRKRIKRKGHYYKMYNYQCNVCGYNNGWMEECDILHHQSGCACCSNNVAVEGINDITTTDPWMISYFQGGYEEAKQYTSGSTKKIYPKCPICGKVKNNKISISQIKKTHSIGCICRDGISYPEKFFIKFLEQLGIKYIYQLSKTTFEWVGRYFYDFYLPDYNCIVETHGGQHYRDIAWSSSSAINENDKYKMGLALNNGIAFYIQLDCRESTMKFISDSILNSELTNLLNITEDIIDWKQCSEFASGNISRDICEFYVSNNHDINITAKQFHLSKTAISRYLRLGSELGWCIFPYHTDRRVLMFKNNICLGTFQSAKHIENISITQFNTYLGQNQIIGNCNRNKYSTNKEYKGFYFIFEPDFLENHEKVS